MKAFLTVSVLALLVTAPAMAQTADVDLRGLDTLKSGSRSSAPRSSGSGNGQGPALNLSDPRLADTFSSAAQATSGLCSPGSSGATVSNCSGLSGGNLLPGDTLSR